MKKPIVIVLKILLCLVLVVVTAACGYVGYVMAAYKRIGNMSLLPDGGSSQAVVSRSNTLTLMSWNVGFGAYSEDYSFFMDGGKYSRAFSKSAVEENLAGVVKTINESGSEIGNTAGCDFICFQEVDFDSTRSHFVNEYSVLRNAFANYWATYAQNYDSPYLLYPLNSPHGANKSGMTTLTKCKIDSAKRVELPVESGFAKLTDLDRCLSVNRLRVVGDRTLVVINMHLTAYSSDGGIATKQLEQLIELCEEEVSAGNYVICAGDFNKDLLGDSAKVFGVNGENYSWAKPFDESILEGSSMSLVVPDADAEKKTPSCRNADAPYHQGQYVVTVDGFLVSSNVKVSRSCVIDTGFKYSDHNPVFINFKLN